MIMNIPPDYLCFKIKILKKLLLGIFVGGIAAFVFGYKGFCLGYIVGGFVAMSIFSLLYKYVLIARGLSLPKRKKFLAIRALILFFIMAITLFIAINKGLDVFLGAAAGMLLLKLVMFVEAIGRIKWPGKTS
ncbi:MAG: hypothetical protein ABIB11_00650 [Candidatus Omnitrophota bacterium]